jgi:hypothetical protein
MRVEWGQIEQPDAARFDGRPHALGLAGAELIHDHQIAGTERRGQGAPGARQRAPLIASRTHKARRAQHDGAARQVLVLQWPCGTAARGRCPRRIRPWRRAMLVVAGLGDQHPSLSARFRLLVAPDGPRCGAIRWFPLGCMMRLGLRVRPSAVRHRLIAAELVWVPTRQTAAPLGDRAVRLGRHQSLYLVERSWTWQKFADRR